MDPRLARNAAARRGRSHLRRMPLEQDRRLRGGHRTLPLGWSETMAYVVGLMAADGCLWSDTRHLSFDSNDRQLVETFLACIGRKNSYRTVKIGRGTTTSKRSSETSSSIAGFSRYALLRERA